ncbi:MAG TPA: hypothetical protein VKB75_11285 [Jatrophihabitans sp.]|nr:hypothetical protein [Jatrophihabitans sp.]
MATKVHAGLEGPAPVPASPEVRTGAGGRLVAVRTLIAPVAGLIAPVAGLVVAVAGLIATSARMELWPAVVVAQSAAATRAQLNATAAGPIVAVLGSHSRRTAHYRCPTMLTSPCSTGACGRSFDR